MGARACGVSWWCVPDNRPYHIEMSRDQYLRVAVGVSHKFRKYDLNGKL